MAQQCGELNIPHTRWAWDGRGWAWDGQVWRSVEGRIQVEWAWNGRGLHSVAQCGGGLNTRGDGRGMGVGYGRGMDIRCVVQCRGPNARGWAGNRR